MQEEVGLLRLETTAGHAPGSAGTESCLGADRPLAQTGPRTCHPGPPPRPTRATVFGEAGLWAPQRLHFRASSVRPQHRLRHTRPHRGTDTSAPPSGRRGQAAQLQPVSGETHSWHSPSAAPARGGWPRAPHTHPGSTASSRLSPAGEGGWDPTAMPGGLDVGAERAWTRACG